MFRRSDIAKMQAIPRELVKAAIRTRSAAIAGIFSANSGAGPTMLDDSTALFHANHGNLATTAFSASEWAAARKRVFGQTVPGTGSKLGLWPTFALLPVDLYDVALEAFGYGTGDIGKPNSGGTAQTVNPYGESRIGDPRPIPVVVPDWTDGTDWAQIVDPRLHPVVQMAYANAPQGGRPCAAGDLRGAQRDGGPDVHQRHAADQDPRLVGLRRGHVGGRGQEQRGELSGC